MEGAGEALGRGDFSGAAEDVGIALRDALKNSGLDPNIGVKLLTNQLAVSAVNVLGGNVSVNQVLSRQEGQVFNPNMELLFNGPTLRNFRFSLR